MEWNLTNAKMRLSEVLDRAETEVQIITRRDQDYVLMNGDTYRQLKKTEPTLVEFLMSGGPSFDDLVPMQRKPSAMRDPGL